MKRLPVVAALFMLLPVSSAVEPLGERARLAKSAPRAQPALAPQAPPFALDASKIPPPAVGFKEERLRPTSERPKNPNDVGAFRTSCDYSHMAFDDPIVYPGQSGKSHLHVFFGNTGIDAHSTNKSINESGNSTCRGGIVNRSGYWVPAMIDMRTGAPVKPKTANFYYKTGYSGVTPESVKFLPEGLRMIAGDAKNARAGGAFRYKCANHFERNGHAIRDANCAVGDEFLQEIFFPQCWDGKNLDSPDHKSHMAYPVNGRGCPRSHPVPLPEITFNIVYAVAEPNQPTFWRLSSDLYDLRQPGGYSAHGDWWNGWKKEVMEAFVKGCDNTSSDCHSHLLGDGRMMY